MEYTIEKRAGYWLARIKDRFVAAYSEGVRKDAFEKLVEEPNIVFDLGEMTHIDSSGLGVLVQLLQRARMRGGTVRLACLQAHPRIVFDITKVYRVFEIYDTVESAEEAFRGGRG